LENDSRQLRNILKYRHNGSIEKRQLTLSQGMLKKGDYDHDEVDDEVSTTVSQSCATATLCTEEFFLRPQFLYLSALINREEWGGDRK
jgi:hypothetical protein